MTDSKLEIDQQETKYWRNSLNQLHRENGPAVIYADGEMFWCIKANPHRIDGPAYVWQNGDKSWWLNEFIREFEYD